MINPNTRIQGAFGDIFTPNTGATDKLSAQLYEEEKQKKAAQEKENNRLDDEFSKQLANIKAADVPEVSQAYNDWKTANQALIKKGQHSTIDDQMKVLQSKADMYKKINGSIEHKEFIKNQTAALKSDTKGLYATNAAQQLTTMLNTPTSKIDRSKDSDLMYQYAVPDLEKELKTARGTAVDKSITAGISKIDPLKDDKEIYKVGNNPNQFYNSLLTDLVKNNKGQNFSGVMDHQYSDQEKENLTEKYIAKTSDPKFISIYGKVDPFPELAMQTKLGQAVALKTMEEVVNNPVVPSKLVSETNLERSKEKDFDIWNRKNKITFPQSLARIKDAQESQQPPNTPYITDEYAAKHGKSLTPSEQSQLIPTLGFTPFGYVEVKDIHPNDFNTITGRDPSKRITGVEPYTFGDKSGFFIDQSGDWIGKGGQRIDREAARDSKIEKRVNTKFKAAAEIKKSEFNTKIPKTVTHNSVETKGKSGKKIYIPN